MRSRIWDELMQCKHKHTYSLHVLQQKKDFIKAFTIVTLIFSAGGVMGWSFWKEFPLMSCAIISCIQIIRLLQPQLIPNDKELEKLNRVIKFYFEYHNKLEQLWYDYERKRISEDQVQEKFYLIKNSEAEINELANEVIRKKVNKKFYKKAELETVSYVQRTFN